MAKQGQCLLQKFKNFSVSIRYTLIVQSDSTGPDHYEHITPLTTATQITDITKNLHQLWNDTSCFNLQLLGSFSLTITFTNSTLPISFHSTDNLHKTLQAP